MLTSVVSPYSAVAQRELVELCAPVRRILTVHSGNLQELLFTLPALKTLRETFEGARITSVIREGLTPLLKSCSLADEVLVRPSGGLPSYAQLMAKLHAQHFDVALAFSTSANGVLLAWSSGAHVRIGFDGAKMDALLTHRIAREAGTPPVIEDYLDLARALGCGPRCMHYCDIVEPLVEEERSVAQWLRERDIQKEFILLAPNPDGKAQRSAAEMDTETVRWVGTARLLAQRAPIVILSSRSQRAVFEKLREYSDRGDLPIYDASGTFSTAAQAALSAQARLFVGYTGSAMHLAAAMSTPVVAVRHKDQKETRLEAEEPRGVAYRLLPCLSSPEQIHTTSLDLIGL